MHKWLNGKWQNPFLNFVDSAIKTSLIAWMIFGDFQQRTIRIWSISPSCIWGTTGWLIHWWVILGTACIGNVAVHTVSLQWPLFICILCASIEIRVVLRETMGAIVYKWIKIHCNKVCGVNTSNLKLRLLQFYTSCNHLWLI